MLTVGALTYAGEDYLVHRTTNGSRTRIILFDVYSKEQRNQIELSSDEDEIKVLKAKRLTKEVISRAMVNKLQDYVVGAIQSDKKGSKLLLHGDTFLLNKFLKEYEFVLNNSYKEDDETRITHSEFEDSIYKTYKDGSYLSLRITRIFGSVEEIRHDVSFSLHDLTYVTSYEDLKPAHSAPYKDWEWTEDLNFDSSSFRRSIISLSAKSLAQLRQEKDMSWCFNKDGSMKKDYKVLHTMDEVRAVVEEIETKRNNLVMRNPNNDMPVAIDCETTGLRMNSLKWFDEFGNRNPLKDEIGGMSLSWKFDQGIYIPFLHTKFQNVDREECLTYLKPYLEKWYLETHNGLFDGKAFMSHGIRLNIKDDSMIMLFNINPTVAKGSKGLKENTLVRYGHEVLDHDDVFPSKKDVTSYYDLSEDVVKIYACADSDYTFRLCHDLRSEVPSIRAYRLDIRVMNYLVKTNYNGNKVDDKLLQGLSTIVDEDIKTIEELMYKFAGQISQLTQATKVLENQIMYGNITREERDKLLEELKHTESFKNARYEFSPSKPDVLVDLLYNKLAYPVVRVSKTSGKPTADKYALKDLAKEEVKSGEEGTWLKSDIMSSSAMYSTDGSYGDTVLIKASEFNKKKYPFVLLLQKWKDMMKLKTTFFAWFLNGACDNMYFSDFSMTNAETSRIIGRIQTLKGAMKKLVVPYSSEWYLMGVDFSQIEARLMAYLAEKWDLVWRLCNPRADYHVESAANLTGKESWEITKAERGELKSVNFAVPYGMAEYSLAENLFGRPVTEEKVEKARILLAKWKKANWEIQTLLDTHRKFAKEMHDVKFYNKETKKVEVTRRRFVVNKFGRRRYFSDGKWNVNSLDFKMAASIDRMAGNYPIQSYAAEIFKTAYVNINKRLEKEGIADKVIVTALVHDEFLFNVHRSVDKYRIYQIIWEEMVQSIYLPYRSEGGEWLKNEDGSFNIDKEHPIKFFFAGISIGPEWHDIHSNDAHEAPNEYLMYMVDQIKSGKYQFKDYEHGDVTKECFEETKVFMRELLFKECKKLQPDLTPNNVKFYQIVPAFFDYFLKGKLKIYVPETSRTALPKDDSDDIRVRLEALLMDKFNTGKLQCYDNEGDTPRTVISAKEEPEVSDGLVVLDMPSLDDLSLDFDLDKSSDTDVNDADFTEMFADLMDDDFDNFDDDDEEETFGISIPVGQYNKEQEHDYTIKGRRTDPNDTRDIWDLVDFNKQITTYDVKESSKFMVRSDTIYIDVSGEDMGKVRTLLNYLATVNDKDGNYDVKLLLNEKTRDTGIKMLGLNKEKIFEVMGWTMFGVMK